MRLFANITSALEITRRISANCHVRQYPHNVQTIQFYRPFNKKQSSNNLRKLFKSNRPYDKMEMRGDKNVKPVFLAELTDMNLRSVFSLKWHYETVDTLRANKVEFVKLIRGNHDDSGSKHQGYENASLNLQQYVAHPLIVLHDSTILEEKSYLALVPFTESGQRNYKESFFTKLGALTINVDEFCGQRKFIYGPVIAFIRSYSTNCMGIPRQKKSKCHLKFHNGGDQYRSVNTTKWKILTPSNAYSGTLSDLLVTKSSMSSQNSAKFYHDSTDGAYKYKSAPASKLCSGSRQSSSDSTSKTVYYNSPFVMELLGGRTLPMSCDTYRNSIIEADKLRAALKKCVEVKRLKNCTSNLHLVMTSSQVTSKRNSMEPLAIVGNKNCNSDVPCKLAETPDFFEKDNVQKINADSSESGCKVPNNCTYSKSEIEGLYTNLREGPSKKTCMEFRPLTPIAEIGKIHCKGDKDIIGGGKSKLSSCSDKNMMDSDKTKPDPCKQHEGKSKKHSPCDDVEKDYKPKCNTDPCDGEKNILNNPMTDRCKKPKTSPCSKKNDKDKSEPKKDDETKIDSTKSGSCAKTVKDNAQPCSEDKNKLEPCDKQDTTKSDSCNNDKKNSEPCTKQSNRQMSDPSAKNEMCPDPCTKQEKNKSVPCNKNGTNNSRPYLSEKKELKKRPSCKTKKRNSRGKDKKPDSCCQKKGPCSINKKNKDSLAKQDIIKYTNCEKGKKKTGPCSQKKNTSKPISKEGESDLFAKQKSAKQTQDNSCAEQVKRQTDPSGKNDADPRGKQTLKNTSPCTRQEKKETEQCNKDNTKSDICVEQQKIQSCGNISQGGGKSKDPCGQNQKDTKPKCKPQGTPNRRCFSTFAACTMKMGFNDAWNHNIPTFLHKRNLSMNKNRCYFRHMRPFSSKGKNIKQDKDLSIHSQCKSLAIKKPPNRRTDQYPNHKEGLRMCYPSNDMECPKKLCKNPRETACNKYPFLKATENNKRKDNK